MNLVVELINGLKVGLEHVAGDPEDPDDVSLIVLDLLIFRVIYVL